MNEVHPSLYVGSEKDCFYNEEDWVVVHACKSPCHQKRVGYRGSLPQTHPNYLILEEENNLFLNMVDMQQALKPEYTNPIMQKAMEFIENNITNKKILIHCNLGESRAPSIAMLFLARKGIIPNNSYQEAICHFKKIYPDYVPGRGIAIYLQNNWDKLIVLSL